MYTKSQFGKELKEQIENGFDVVKISRWAHDNVLMNHQKEIDSDLKSIIMQIIAMDMGKEFELSKTELSDLANNLLTVL